MAPRGERTHARAAPHGHIVRSFRQSPRRVVVPLSPDTHSSPASCHPAFIATVTTCLLPLRPGHAARGKKPPEGGRLRGSAGVGLGRAATAANSPLSFCPGFFLLGSSRILRFRVSSSSAHNPKTKL
jgi:hypothetical protein